MNNTKDIAVVGSNMTAPNESLGSPETIVAEVADVSTKRPAGLSLMLFRDGTIKAVSIWLSSGFADEIKKSKLQGQSGQRYSNGVVDPT